MNRKGFLIGMTMVFGAALTGCHTEHEWQEADCTQPQTCAVCGETQGEALGHDWQDADYFTPQKCRVCGEEQGGPLQPSFEAHGLSANARVGETYDYVTCCATDHSLTTVGKLTFSDYRVFEDSILEGYEWRAVHIKIEFSDDNAQNYGVGVHYSNEDYYDTEAWDAVYDRKDNQKLYTIRYQGKEYTECKSMFSGPGFSNRVDGVETWEGDVFAVVPAGYDGMVVCFRNAGLEEKAGDCIYDVADEDTIFFRMSDEGATAIPPVGAAEPLSEKEMDALLQTMTENFSTQLPLEITDRLYDLTSSVMIHPFEDFVSLEIKVGRPEYIPDMATYMNEFIREYISEDYYSRGNTIFIKYIASEPDGSEDASSCERWYSKDGVKGEFISIPDDVTIADCTIQQLYDHYADRLGIADQEQILENVRELLLENCQALLYGDGSSVLVYDAEGEINIYVRTYEKYLIPALAEKAVEAVYEEVRRSALPFGTLSVYCIATDEDGRLDETNSASWRTMDMETGTFASTPEAVYEELYTIEDMYDHYWEYHELIDRALKGERVDDGD